MKEEPESPKEVSLLRFCLGYLMLLGMLVGTCWLFYVVLLETIAADWAYIRYGPKTSNYLMLIVGIFGIPSWIGWMVEIFRMRFYKPKDKNLD